jgi:hypothetical protein
MLRCARAIDVTRCLRARARARSHSSDANEMPIRYVAYTTDTLIASYPFTVQSMAEVSMR